MEVLEVGKLGVAAVLAVVVWVLVDKVVVPLFQKQTAGSTRYDERFRSLEQRAAEAQQKWQHQDYVNNAHGQRLDRLDGELAEIRGALGEVRRTVDVASAVLERIEDAIK